MSGPKRALNWIHGIFALLLIAAVVSGCGGKEDNNVIASYEGGEIQQDEFNKYKSTLELLNSNFAQSEADPKFEETTLHQLIAIKVISAKAKSDIKKTQAKIAEEEFTLIKQYVQSQPGGGDQWDKRLEDLDLTEKDIKNNMERTYIAAEVLGKNVEEQEIKEQYEQAKKNHVFDPAFPPTHNEEGGVTPSF